MKGFALFLLLASANAVSQCGFQRTDYAVPSPYHLLFQGGYIWVTSFDGNTVNKVRADDGAVVGTFPVGRNPSGLAFDGADIWVANESGDTVTKLRASDGTSLGTFPAGNAPSTLAFDGTSIWVTDYLGVALTQLKASDGSTLATYGLPWSPAAVLFDGTNLWTTEDAYPGSDSAVRKINPADGSVLGVFPLGGNGRLMAFDGANVWVTNVLSNTVSKLRASDGANVGTFAAGGAYPFVIAFDGNGVWVTDNLSNNVIHLRTSDGANLDSCNVGTNPVGVAFDGLNIWVANYGSGTVSRLFRFTVSVQPPINADGSSIFSSKRGVVPVRFTLADNGAPTCNLPPATISLFRTNGSSPGQVNESDYISPADSGSDFRISGCQYIYNLSTRSLGPGSYTVKLSINGVPVGSADFGLQ